MSIPPNPNDDVVDLAERVMTSFLNLMARFDSLSKSTIINIITVGVWDNKDRKELFYMVRDHDNPSKIPGLEFRLREAIPSSIHMAERVGGLSGLASMVFEPQLGLDSWELYNPELLIKNLKEGDFAWMTGPQDTGKTNNSCVIIEEWAMNDNLCVSNIFKKKKSDAYEYANNARSLFEIVASFPREKKWLFVYDEGGASGYGKSDAATYKSKNLDKFFRMIRKLYGNLLYIDQRESSVPSAIHEWTTSKFTAVEQKTIHINLIAPFEFQRTVTDFPKTKLPYDTRDIAAFEMNVNVEKAFQSMSGESKPYDALLDFLKTKESEPPKGRIT